MALGCYVPAICLGKLGGAVVFEDHPGAFPESCRAHSNVSKISAGFGPTRSGPATGMSDRTAFLRRRLKALEVAPVVEQPDRGFVSFVGYPLAFMMGRDVEAASPCLARRVRSSPLHYFSPAPAPRRGERARPFDLSHNALRVGRLIAFIGRLPRVTQPRRMPPTSPTLPHGLTSITFVPTVPWRTAQSRFCQFCRVPAGHWCASPWISRSAGSITTRTHTLSKKARMTTEHLYADHPQTAAGRRQAGLVWTLLLPVLLLAASPSPDWSRYGPGCLGDLVLAHPRVQKTLVLTSVSPRRRRRPTQSPGVRATARAPRPRRRRRPRH